MDIYCRILPTRAYTIGTGNRENLQAKALLLPAVFGTVYLMALATDAVADRVPMVRVSRALGRKCVLR